MKKQILYLLILVFPFLGMVMINEFVRISKEKAGDNRQGVIAINSVIKYERKCSWTCHNNTTYCKENHVKFLKPYFEKIDPIYFGIVFILKSTGKYGLANIIFLVILLPLIMYLLLVKSINIQLEIRKIKRED